jgi:hypothetical protein
MHGLPRRLAEAVVRGSLEALDAFAKVADELRGTPFQSHVTVMLRKRADALQAVGGDDEATIARVEVAWHVLDHVRACRCLGQPIFVRDSHPGAQSSACYAITARVRALGPDEGVSGRCGSDTQGRRACAGAPVRRGTTQVALS